MTYGGTPPAITPAYTGFVNGDGVSSLTTEPTCSTTATSASPVPGSPYALLVHRRGRSQLHRHATSRAP